MGLRKEIVLLALVCLLSGCGKTGNGEKGRNSQQPPEAPGSLLSIRRKRGRRLSLVPSIPERFLSVCRKLPERW